LAFDRKPALSHLCALSIRQELLVEVMQIIDRSGTRLALPTEVHYSARDAKRSDALPTPPEKPA
jgi:hypothetical protein